MLGLQGFGVRGASEPGGTAYATGGTVGTVLGSFGQLAPFNPAGFVQPKVSDLGTTTNGASVTSTTPDGILDFGGTLATQKFTSLSNTGGLIFGGGASGLPSPTGGWQWEVAQFKFNIGATGPTVGATTSFLPLQVASGTATAATISVNGATAISVPVTVGSPLGFTVIPGVVTGAVEDNSNTAGVFGPPQTFPVAAGGPYNSVDSTVSSVSGTGGSPALGVGGRARILAGSNSGAQTTVGMGWRSRLNPSEISPAKHPPMADSVTTGLVSDVVDVNGVTPGDAYVLDMNYNPALLPKGGSPAIEQGLAHNKLIYMVSPGPAAGDGSQYFNTVSLNTGNVVTSPLDNRYGYVGSYAQFQADPLGGNGGTPASEVGSWGDDPVNHEVWAVVTHNSTFAVVPEPSTLLLVGLGLLGLVGLRRRIKA
jgi:hypothetical protein